jgi:hypothetical protein
VGAVEGLGVRPRTDTPPGDTIEARTESRLCRQMSATDIHPVFDLFWIIYTLTGGQRRVNTSEPDETRLHPVSSPESPDTEPQAGLNTRPCPLGAPALAQTLQRRGFWPA